MTRRRPENQLPDYEGDEALDTFAARARHRRPLRKGRRRIANRLIPLIFFTVLAVFIAKQEIPAVDDFLNGLLDPKGQMALQACRDAALKNGEHPSLNRLLRRGVRHRTVNGFFIDQIVIGTPGRTGGEQRIQVSCHVNLIGRILDMHTEVLPLTPISQDTFRTGPDPFKPMDPAN